MSSQCATLAWEHGAAGGLRLRIAESSGSPGRSVVLPAAISHELTGSDGPGVTADPAGDLVELESRIRLRAARLAEITARRRLAVTVATGELTATRGLRGGVLRRDHRRRATQLGAAVDELTSGVAARNDARSRVRAVREFIVALNLREGLLADACLGWQRDPIRPAFVSTFATEAVFVTADPRRASGWDTVVIGGDQYGVGWRRDGDDDDPHTDQAAVLGPWQLGYIPVTGEVYASRRCHYLPPQVWLLGRGFTHPDHTRQLLAELKQRHMLEPNSLIHAAHRVYRAARPARTQTVTAGRGWG